MRSILFFSASAFLYPHPLPPASGLACTMVCFPSHALINKIFSSCLHLSLSIAAVTNNIFSLIPFLTFFPPWPSRWHQEICISILRVHNTGTTKIIHDTRNWKWHDKQVLFDIYAGMTYKALLAKHCSQISHISRMILTIQLGLSKQSLHTFSKKAWNTLIFAILLPPPEGLTCKHIF